MWCFDVLDERCDEVPVQLPKMTVRGFENLVGVCRNVVFPELKFVELECEPLLLGQYTRCRTKAANDMCIMPGNDECENFVTGCEVLHHGRPFRKRGLKRLKCRDRHLLQRSVFRVVSRYIAQG